MYGTEVLIHFALDGLAYGLSASWQRPDGSLGHHWETWDDGLPESEAERLAGWVRKQVDSALLAGDDF